MPQRRFFCYFSVLQGETDLANLVRWAARGTIPLEVLGHGLLDCNVYTQPGRVIMHIMNLSNTGRMPIEEYLPVGPLTIRLKLPKDVSPGRLRLAVSGITTVPKVENGCGWLFKYTRFPTTSWRF